MCSMKVLIFLDSNALNPNATSNIICNYLLKELKEKNIEATVFNLSEASIPFLDFNFSTPPQAVKNMCTQFLDADTHFWLTPLYHGSIPGAMKNCLDWLEITAPLPEPYLMDKKIAMVCWSDGVQAMNGIHTMENIAKSLRAWPLPYSVPIIRKELMHPKKRNIIAPNYISKLDRLIEIAISRKISIEEN